MTISVFIDWVTLHPNPVLIYMIVVPALSFISSMFITSPVSDTPSKYIYSVLIYATCIPGVLAIVLSGYSLVMQRMSLLDMNVLVYFVPIISMAFSIAVISRAVRMAEIPGFKRLSGFMMMIGVTFVLVFILQKMFIGVLFFGTLTSLVILFAILFIVIKLGWDRMFK